MECKLCHATFSNYWTNPETGKKHNLCRRSYCLVCSPFGKHNTTIPVITLSGQKKCPKCKETKFETEFYYKDKERTRYSSYCKLCMNQLTLERQRQRKHEAVQYKGGKCERCGYNKYEGALEFHHTDPTQKDFELSASKFTSFNKYKLELDKCQLLCSNCHKEIHSDLVDLVGFEPTTCGL